MDVVRNDQEARYRDLDGQNCCILWGNVDRIEEIGREDPDEGVEFVVNAVLSSRSLYHLLKAREASMDLYPLTAEGNIRCWDVLAHGKSVVRRRIEIRICARVGMDIHDSCDSASNNHRGHVLVIAVPLFERIRRVFYGNTRLDICLDWEVDKGVCRGRSETDLVILVLADERVMLEWAPKLSRRSSVLVHRRPFFRRHRGSTVCPFGLG